MTFKEQRAEREAKANQRFEATQKEMQGLAREYINNRIDDQELFDRLNAKQMTKTALLIYIYRDLKSRRLPKF